MGIAVGGGLIDSGYTGQVKVMLRNYRNADSLFTALD